MVEAWWRQSLDLEERRHSCTTLNAATVLNRENKDPALSLLSLLLQHWMIINRPNTFSLTELGCGRTSRVKWDVLCAFMSLVSTPSNGLYQTPNFGHWNDGFETAFDNIHTCCWKTKRISKHPVFSLFSMLRPQAPMISTRSATFVILRFPGEV